MSRGAQELDHDLKMRLEHGLEHSGHHMKGVEEHVRESHALLETRIREVTAGHEITRACAHTRNQKA